MCAFQIAIDGPAGAGKSTIAKKIAEKLSFIYIDTGAMYRALTYEVLDRKIAIDNIEEIIHIAKNCNIAFKNKDVFVNNNKVNDDIRSRRVNENVSYIAKIPEVRNILVDRQKKIASNNNIVMDGRDIGTKVLPNANLKIFLTASVEERALRRYNEIKCNNSNVDIESIRSEIVKRDAMDESREHSPLKKAINAVTIDTTGLTIKEVVENILILVRKQCINI
ncbi:MAG: cytidylate kinase [Alkaliphilus sp.]|nr:MAG: cytidylate kinase [Alkaliphilus sp.]